MAMQDDETRKPALWLGLGSAALLVMLEAAYAITLGLGLMARNGPDSPVGDPHFTLMELLILAIAPAMVTLAIAVHASCPQPRKPFALAAVVLAAILATITSSVHASTLLLGREPAFAGMDRVFAFEWPSVVYVLDVLAWDWFFGLFAIFLALSFERSGRDRWARRLLVLSGALALAGLWGVFSGDMGVRNAGILGYVVVFTVAVSLIGFHLWEQATRR